jgi:inosine-uridine nucleoside N-ribohydrolase
MALASDNVDVVAITTVLGNTTAPQVANNVKRYEKPNNLKFYGARKAYGRIVLILNNNCII